MIRVLRRWRCITGIATLCATMTVAHAQTAPSYPAKSVRIVIPFGTGGTNLIARWLAPKFS